MILLKFLAEAEMILQKNIFVSFLQNPWYDIGSPWPTTNCLVIIQSYNSTTKGDLQLSPPHIPVTASPSYVIKIWVHGNQDVFMIHNVPETQDCHLAGFQQVKSIRKLHLHYDCMIYSTFAVIHKQMANKAIKLGETHLTTIFLSNRNSSHSKSSTTCTSLNIATEHAFFSKS